MSDGLKRLKEYTEQMREKRKRLEAKGAAYCAAHKKAIDDTEAGKTHNFLIGEGRGYIDIHDRTN